MEVWNKNSQLTYKHLSLSRVFLNRLNLYERFVFKNKSASFSFVDFKHKDSSMKAYSRCSLLIQGPTFLVLLNNALLLVFNFVLRMIHFNDHLRVYHSSNGLMEFRVLLKEAIKRE